MITSFFINNILFPRVGAFCVHAALLRRRTVRTGSTRRSERVKVDLRDIAVNILPEKNPRRFDKHLRRIADIIFRAAVSSAKHVLAREQRLRPPRHLRAGIDERDA